MDDHDRFLHDRPQPVLGVCGSLQPVCWAFQIFSGPLSLMIGSGPQIPLNWASAAGKTEILAVASSNPSVPHTGGQLLMSALCALPPFLFPFAASCDLRPHLTLRVAPSSLEAVRCFEMRNDCLDCFLVLFSVAFFDGLPGLGTR